jgi:hypothetical protein
MRGVDVAWSVNGIERRLANACAWPCGVAGGVKHASGRCVPAFTVRSTLAVGGLPVIISLT